ncbi:MAG TPA: CHASE domain-containing protein [Candidatus Limnocylindria bacterium]|nr:CHASE domain-containing protein [Candidatus Limnocylindria bacterium]
MLVIGLVLSLTLFLFVRGSEQREREALLVAAVREQVEKLEVTMLRSMEVLHSIAALRQLHENLGREEFRAFVEQALARQPELQALSWNPLVPAAQRAKFETAATAESSTNFTFREEDQPGHLVRERERDSYVPVFFIEPLQRNASALGYDLNSDPTRRRSLEQARDSGEMVATAPIRLTQAGEDEKGFLVLLPVYRGGLPASIAERRVQLDGFAVAVFRMAELVRRSFQDLHAKGIEVVLFDQSPDGEKLFSNVAGSVNATPEAAHAVTLLNVANRKWTVRFTPSPKFFASQAASQSWLVLLGGFAFTLVTTGYLYNGWRRTCEVAAANAALQKEIVIRRQAEATAAAANGAKSDFLASMSHEIRTPLNAILGYAQLLQRDPHLLAEQRDGVRGIYESGHHLLGLINEVLDLAKIEAGRMDLNETDFDLGTLGRGLMTTFKPLCAQKKIGFRIEAATRRVRGDEGKLRQVLINLLGNAVKFTNAGEVYLRFVPAAEGHWLFEVIDTGLGIPEAEQADIFKPFHQGTGTAHQGGTGLGLAIAQRQVELLGGKLELQSERGIGSRFVFTIPLAAAQDEEHETDSEIVHRGVSFQYSGATHDGEPTIEHPLDRITLPENLCVRLMVAAELHSTTTLKIALQELRQHGPQAQQLAEQIRLLMRSYDMEAIQHLLARVAIPSDNPRHGNHDVQQSPA